MYSESVLDMTEGYQEPTYASLSRSRSPSLSKRFDDIDLTDTTIRPPFVVRKVR